jgi:hypothetical protein
MMLKLPVFQRFYLKTVAILLQLLSSKIVLQIHPMCGKHLQNRMISLRSEVYAHRISSTLPLFYINARTMPGR